ncbi:hypothetical protein H4R21_006453, partial [Coemansia helicoidea]
LEALVEQIREDVVMSSDDAVVNAALNTLEAVYGAVSPAAPTDTSDASTPLDYVLKDAVFRLTAESIENPDQVGRILRAAACSSAYNCAVVSDAVVTVIVERLNATDVLTTRRELMDVLNHVLSASCEAGRRAEGLDADRDSLLNVYQPDTSVPLDKEYSFLHITRLKGIALLVMLPDFLDAGAATVALQTVARAAIERNEDDNVNKQATHLLVQLSQSQPAQVEAAVLPMFFGALCEDAVAAHQVARLLNALGAIGVASPKALLAVLAGLTAAVTSGGLAPAHHAAAATTIRKMVGAGAALGSAADLCPRLAATAVDPLADWAHGASQRGAPVADDVVLEIARAIAAAYSGLDVEAQERHLERLFGRYAETAQAPASGADGRLLPLFSAAVCACRPQARLPVADPAQLLGALA